MSREVETGGFGPVTVTAAEWRAAAVHAADRIAARHPHLPGRRIAHDPTSRADVRELLHAIGFLPEPQGAHVSTTDKPKQAEIADAAEKAAKVIEANGLHKGYLYDEQQAKTGLDLARCRVDAVGAVNVAVFGKPQWPAEEHESSPLAQAVVLALQETVRKPVPGWNDEDERTDAEVVTALTNTANRLREAS